MTHTMTPQETMVDLAEPMDLEMVTADYIQRIHWWVRLFGIVWVVIPAVAAVVAVVFLLTMMIAGS